VKLKLEEKNGKRLEFVFDGTILLQYCKNQGLVLRINGIFLEDFVIFSKQTNDNFLTKKERIEIQFFLSFSFILLKRMCYSLSKKFL